MTSIRVRFAVTLHLAIAALLAWNSLDARAAEPDAARTKAGESAQPPIEESPSGSAAGKTENGEPSLAERVANLRQSISEDEDRLEQLQAKQREVETEFEEAGQAFQSLEEEVESLEEKREQVVQAGDSEDAGEVAEDLKELQSKKDLAKQRFDLAIQARQNATERIAALEAKLAQSRQSLDKLLGGDAAAKEPEAAMPTDAVAESSAEPAAAASEKSPAEVGDAAGDAARMLQGLPPEGQTTPENAPAESAEPAEPPSEEVQKAEESLAEAQAAVAQAEEEVADVETRLELLDRNIDLARTARNTALANARNAEQTIGTLQQQLAQQREAGAAEGEIDALRQQMGVARDRRRQFEQEAREESATLDELQAERGSLLAEQVTALRSAEEQQQAAEAAEKELNRAKNPFSPANLKASVLRHGPPVLVILVGMFLAQLLVRLLAHRIIHFIVRGSRRGTVEEKEQRAKTLVGVFRNTATIAIYGGALLMILDELTIPITALMGGVAVVGLAVAFGAQNLIKDYFYGFMILMENQYSVNDVVRIAGIAGLVENITLRMTVLRDLEGIVHFVPHGEVKTVSNLTHGWSRAVFDIGVAYKEDVDRVIQVLEVLGEELLEDPEFSYRILDKPEMLGVDAFGDSAVVIKFLIKTRPLQQWGVKREMLRRIKRRFDQLGIEIPFPHRTIYYGNMSGDSSEVAAGADASRGA